MSENLPTISLLTRAFASGLFSGYSPVASGTIGSAVGLLLYLIPGFEIPYIIIPAVVVAFFFGVRAARLMERRYGHDPAQVTIDEIVGMWVSLLFLPKSLLIAGAAFFLFRVFDILKPFPARKFDAKNGGIGIMMDDVIAGIYTNIAIQLMIALEWFETIEKFL